MEGNRWAHLRLYFIYGVDAEAAFNASLVTHHELHVLHGEIIRLPSHGGLEP